ncbi:GNAT family N-acetyltransferase [Nocardia rhizosphaerihabitans]|uniref:N-acetyltransferase n=1 Tax=Nocardia rhizosphaerihabitans TaxID=1691570 RepID=A0ABQ2KVC9_9NOCA|nr:GNAT family N-acetyltransferase [Nocardia rhizosphaerihabitans]GGN94494.1 N-acetyltransferase [Nocardia rhizosphaerihabitans]
MKPHVRQAGPDELAAVTDAFVAASLDEVVSAWIRAGDPVVDEAYRTIFGPQFVAKAMAADEVWVAGDGEDIWAVSLWQTVTSADRLAAEAAEANELLAAAPEVVSFQRMAAVSSLVAAAHPREFPHRYLHVIVTVPEHRGKGAGGAILADRLAAFADAGETAFLEASTQRSSRLYARNGFAHEGEAIELPDDGPTLLPMWFRG